MKWIIPHPGTLEVMEIKTFEEGMDHWFEGFNLPRKVLFPIGKIDVYEPFFISCFRVEQYLRRNR